MSGITLDPATKSAGVTLSNSNRTAAWVASGAVDVGALGRAADALSTGKYYFEYIWNTANGPDNGVGFATAASTYVNLGASATVGALVFASGNVYINGSFTGVDIASPLSSGDVIGIAVDFGAHLVWFKDITTGGNWNASGPANPATGVGGLTIPSLTFVPAIVFSPAQSAQVTLNSGQAAFSGAVPAGFTSGWPGTVPDFTPNRGIIIGW